MDRTTLIGILGLVASLWLILSLAFYHFSRRAAHLAGATGASALFFAGAMSIASVMTDQWIFVVPFGLGIVILALVHVISAGARTEALYSSSGEDESASPLDEEELI